MNDRSNLSSHLLPNDTNNRKDHFEVQQLNNQESSSTPVKKIATSIELLGTTLSTELFFVSIFLNTTKFLTYLVLIGNVKSENNFIDFHASRISILMALLFAALSMTNAGFPIWKELVLGFIIASEIKDQYAMKGTLGSFELVNFFMLATTSCFIVPGQGTPLNIVLNSVALVTIAQLDQGFFNCFHFQGASIEGFEDRKKMKDMQNSRLFMAVYGFFLVTGIIALVFIYIFYYKHDD